MIPDFYIAFAVYYVFSQTASNSHNCLSAEYQRVSSCHFEEETKAQKGYVKVTN